MNKVIPDLYIPSTMSINDKNNYNIGGIIYAKQADTF
jgi:hypothetical protein